MPILKRRESVSELRSQTCRQVCVGERVGDPLPELDEAFVQVWSAVDKTGSD